jgi:hypothetical protein
MGDDEVERRQRRAAEAHSVEAHSVHDDLSLAIHRRVSGLPPFFASMAQALKASSNQCV